MSTSKIKDRIARGFGANMYGQAVTMLVQLVGVPILLTTWGAQLYGEWLILFAMPAYLSMTNLGLAQSAGNDMTACVNRGDHARALTVFQSTAALVWAVSAIGLFVSAIVFSILPIGEWLHFRGMGSEDVRWVLVLLSAEVFVRLPNGVTHAGFRASGEYALHVSLDSSTRLLQFVGIWIVALAGGGPVTAAGTFFVVRAISTAMLAMLLIRRHCWLRIGFKQASIRELRRLARPALANMAIPLAQALNVEGMVLAVGMVLGPLAVVVFSTLRTLTRFVLQLVVAVSHSTEPELAAAYGSGDYVLMKNLYVHMLRASLWLAVIGASLLTLFGPEILKIWTHGNVGMKPWLFGWLLISAVSTAFWYGAFVTLRSANEHVGVAVAYIVLSGLSVGGTIVLLLWSRNIASAGLALWITDVGMASYALSRSAGLFRIGPLSSLAGAVNPYPLINWSVERTQAQ